MFLPLFLLLLAGQLKNLPTKFDEILRWGGISD